MRGGTLKGPTHTEGARHIEGATHTRGATHTGDTQTDCSRFRTRRSFGLTRCGWPALGLYKIFVCLLGDCALVNTILGIQRLLHCIPRRRCILQSILRNIWVLPAPGFAIQHITLVIAISCKSQAGTRPQHIAYYIRPFDARSHA